MSAVSDKNTHAYFIDIGNTQIKYSVSTGDKTQYDNRLVPLQRINHDNIDNLVREIQSSSAKKIIVTAGRSESAQTSLERLQTALKRTSLPTHVVSIDNTLLPINYTDSSQFGVDRYLNLLGARQYFSRHFCVISAGTAITLDFYTDCHIGGVIAPGLGQCQALLADKAGLNTVDYPEGLLGNDTASTIGAGLYHGLNYLISGNIQAVAAANHCQFNLLYTGGDASFFCQQDDLYPQLLFKGMNFYSNRRDKQ